MRKVILISFIVLLIVPSFASGLDTSITLPEIDLSQNRYEGPGWNSGEEAAAYYLAGLKSGDMQAMLRSFAIETYVDSYDIALMINRIQMYMPTSSTIKLPNSNASFRNANIESRRAQLANALVFQLMSLSYPNFDLLKPLSISSYDGGVEGLVSFLAIDEPPFESLELVGFTDPAQMNDLYSNQKNMEQLQEKAAICGADEQKSLAVIIEIKGESYLFAPDVIRYKDSWYMSEPAGTLSILLGASSLTGGILPLVSDSNDSNR